MTPEQHPILLGDLDGLKHDMWFSYCEQQEAPDPREFSKWAIQHRGSFALWLTQDTDLSFNEWQAARVNEDMEAENG